MGGQLVEVTSPTDVLAQKSQYRNYVDSAVQDRVQQLYYENHVNQTLEYVIQKKRQMLQLNKFTMSVWDAMLKLNELVDSSDPDTSLPQVIHLLQTAEAIRAEFPGEEYDWFHLTGLIHDLGKVLAHPDLFNEPQWAVVGDTFPLGCQFSSDIIFPKLFENNPDCKVPQYSTKYGIYHEGIGLDNVHFSWGHDEYMYSVCKKAKEEGACLLPDVALYIIRFHSAYCIHQKNAYPHLMNEKDREFVPWLKTFQKYDLYSKKPTLPPMEELLAYYKKLIDKYFPTDLHW